MRPELPSGDWRESTTAGLANLIEACWAQAHAERPAFGGAMGVVERIDGLEVYPNPNPDPDPNPNPNPSPNPNPKQERPRLLLALPPPRAPG